MTGSTPCGGGKLRLGESRKSSRPPKRGASGAMPHAIASSSLIPKPSPRNSASRRWNAARNAPSRSGGRRRQITGVVAAGPQGRHLRGDAGVPMPVVADHQRDVVARRERLGEAGQCEISAVAQWVARVRHVEHLQRARAAQCSHHRRAPDLPSARAARRRCARAPRRPTQDLPTERGDRRERQRARQELGHPRIPGRRGPRARSGRSSRRARAGARPPAAGGTRPGSASTRSRTRAGRRAAFDRHASARRRPARATAVVPSARSRRRRRCAPARARCSR